MAQTICESSLRPDWLSVSFKSASEKHQGEVWGLVQDLIGRVTDDAEWQTGNASAHFDRCLRHPIGARFETQEADGDFAHLLSVFSLSGSYWALSSVYEQMRLITELNKFKGRYNWTRFDAQVTTLNPSQSAEQICTDLEEGRLWVKNYRGWEQKGLRDINGNVIDGASACFGAAVSDKRATSYNKAAEQGWKTPARRDEVRLRNQWAREHMKILATAIAGASSEDAAIEAYQAACAQAISQHMQYLDLSGQPIPRPKDWARSAKRPKWWNETLEQQHEPVKLTRKPKTDVFERIAHMRMQWAPTWAEACAQMVVEGRSDSVAQASFDLAQTMLSGLRPEHVQRVLDKLPMEERQIFLDELMEAADAASVHAEVT